MKLKNIYSPLLSLTALVAFTIPAMSQDDSNEIEVVKEEIKMVTFLGVETSRVSKALRNHVDIPDGVGLTIDHVAEGTGAEEAGIQQYDILLMLDDQIIINQEQLSTLIQSKKPGDRVNVEVLRKGKKIRSKVELGEREAKRFHRWGHNFSRPTPPNPIFPQNWNFNFDSEEFQERMKEIQEKAAEMGNKAMQYIPEIIVERDEEDGSKRVTTFGRGKKKATISNDDLIAEVSEVDGKREFLVRKSDSENGKILYEGEEPSEKELKALPENVREIISRLNDMNALNLEGMEDLKNENIRIRIITGKEEAKAPPSRSAKEEV